MGFGETPLAVFELGRNADRSRADWPASRCVNWYFFGDRAQIPDLKIPAAEALRAN
jgi:hypothetical protein